MPTITYFIRFVLRDPNTSIPYEEQEYTHLTDAWEAFRLFAEPDSVELYTQVELAAHHWETDEEYQIAHMEFAILTAFKSPT